MASTLITSVWLSTHPERQSRPVGLSSAITRSVKRHEREPGASAAPKPHRRPDPRLRRNHRVRRAEEHPSHRSPSAAPARGCRRSRGCAERCQSMAHEITALPGGIGKEQHPTIDPVESQLCTRRDAPSPSAAPESAERSLCSNRRPVAPVARSSVPPLLVEEWWNRGHSEW